MIIHRFMLNGLLKRNFPFKATACVALLFFGTLFSCDERAQPDVGKREELAYNDTVFWQEYHDAYPVGGNAEENEVRSITTDREQNVWVATRAGVFVKRQKERIWKSVFSDEDKGPAFSVLEDGEGRVWMSTWKGLYVFEAGVLKAMSGPMTPVARLARSPDGVYALGPHGVWLYSASRWARKTDRIARSVRDAVADSDGGLWVGTDVGLYYVNTDTIKHFIDTAALPSAYVRGVGIDDDGKLWAGGLGGVSVLDKSRSEKKLSTENGIPSIQVNAVKNGPDGIMWIGTDKGVVRYNSDFHASLRFSRRWLLDDKVNDITFDNDGNAWLATPRGVSAIKRKKMTLSGKAAYFYDVLMRRHIRDPWIAGQCKLPTPGDTTVWLPDDDDNDGEYTGNYLAMESFRYAVTKDPVAKENAGKAFAFLRFLQEVTGTDGFFARTIVPSDWKEVDDGNRKYDDRQRADELIKEPRFKPVEVRWHRSADGEWMWKGDTSSDEMGGHMMGYFFYYELAADEADKEEVRKQVVRIVDHLIKNDYNLTDVDGTHTRWGVWSPDQLNRDPEWMPDRNLNSMELLSFVKLAAYVTGERKYEDAYRHLIEKEGYLENMSNIEGQNPGWFIYFDVMLAAYQYPILLKCEKDPELLAFYEKHMDAWFDKYRGDQNPLINFLYCFSRNKKLELASSVEFLRDTPLDLVDWPIDHTQREDVTVVRFPVMDDVQIDEVPPASIRGTIRWDKNPYSAVSGNPFVEREPVFWLLPYWMGRYLGMINPPDAR